MCWQHTTVCILIAQTAVRQTSHASIHTHTNTHADALSSYFYAWNRSFFAHGPFMRLYRMQVNTNIHIHARTQTSKHTHTHNSRTHFMPNRLPACLFVITLIHFIRRVLFVLLCCCLFGRSRRKKHTKYNTI